MAIENNEITEEIEQKDDLEKDQSGVIPELEKEEVKLI
jgi:hypothetical protein